MHNTRAHKARCCTRSVPLAALLAALSLAGCGQSATTSTSTASTAPSTRSASSSTRTTAQTPKHAPKHAQKRLKAKRPAPRPRGSAGLAYSTASAQAVQPQPALGSCHALDSALYSRPDRSCTPGALNPAVTQVTIGQTICVPGWTSTVRPPESVTEPEKQASMAAYGDTGPLSAYEFDHFLPLELGGAVNDPRNLWPEPGAAPNPKDSVENDLRSQVCAGQLTLAAAQHAIVANWTKLAGAPSAPTSGPTGTPSPSGGAQCSASASYSSRYGDYNVYVHSNQPAETVIVSDSSGRSDSWHADSSGDADVYFKAPASAAGETVTVHAGAATCQATL